MKKLFALLLAMIMVFSLAATAFAEGDPTQTTPSNGKVQPLASNGSITIHSVAVKKHEDNSYKPVSSFTAYQMLYLESYDATSGKYNYKANPEWEVFFTSAEVTPYIAMNENKYVEWKGSDQTLQTDAATVSKLALAYAQAHKDTFNRQGNETPIVFGSFTVVNETVKEGVNGSLTANITKGGLPLGYYLVDSTAGALCGLTTTNPDADFAAKNVPPVATKQVQEDDIKDGSPWRDKNIAEIGSIVNFDATINVNAGAENYVFHDKMDDGLTLFVDDDHPILIKHKKSDAAEGHVVNAGYYTINHNNNDTCSANCTFEIVFNEEFHKLLAAGDTIVITYSAILNGKADVANGTQNMLWMTYGEGNSTTYDTTVTQTLGFDLAKVTSDGALLKGAEFELYRTYTEETDEETGSKTFVLGGQVHFVDTKEPVKINNIDVPVYRVATEAEIADLSVVTFTTLKVENGILRIHGVDTDHYYLKETKAPKDYNLLLAPTTISIKEGGDYLDFANGKPVTGSGIHVVNKSGTILPETGAMGTAMFITFGMFVVLGTGVLLVTKKRMSMIED